MVYDVREARRHADNERKDGNHDDQQVAHAEQTKTQRIPFALVDVDERQEVDNGRERDADGRQAECTNQRDQMLQVRYSDGQENCGQVR